MHQAARVVLAAIATLAFVACPDNSVDEEDAGVDGGVVEAPPGGSDAGTDAGTDAGSNGTRTITVTAATTYFTNAGQTVVPADLTSGQYAALMWNGTAFQSYPGTGTAQGTLTIPNVPSGEYYLKWQRSTVQTFIVTSDEALDLSTFRSGRPDVELADAGTTLTVNATGLPPWEPGSQLEVFSANANAWGFNAEWSLETSPTEGASPTKLNFAYSDLMLWNYKTPTPLIQGSKGDDAHVTLLVPKTYAVGDVADGGFTSTYYSLDRSFSTLALTMTNGTNTNLDAPFIQPVNVQTATVDWRRSQFAALRPQVHPRAQSANGDSIYVSALPYTGAHGAYTSSADLAFVAPDFDGDVVVPLSWRNPFPFPWTTAASLVIADYVRFQETDGGTLNAFAFQTSDDLMPAFADGAITPKVTPVTNLKINGQNGQEDQTSNATPYATWSAPLAVGPLAGYQVDVIRLYRDTFSHRERVARFYTRKTEVRIPPGVLEAGQHYVLVITAEASSTDFDTNPFQFSFPSSSADALSGLLTIK